MIQNALTVIVPIKRDELDSLQNLLTSIGNDIEDNPLLNWQESPSTHFARFVILKAAVNSSDNVLPALKGSAPRLLFTSNHDGSFESYMGELVSKFGESMEAIWSKCEGYKPGTSSNAAEFASFITAHSHLKRNAPPETLYIACRGVSVEEISQSIALREALNRVLDSPETGELLRNTAPAPPQSPTAPSSPSGSGNSIIARLGSLVRGLAEGLVGIREGLNPNLPVNSPETQLAVEDRVTQNQMTVIVPVRPDLKARLLLPLILKIINGVAAKSTGSLSGLTTIHFARWSLIDGGRNLFFESNFDGSWENYIDDFVDRASLGMNIIWGNCTGFPQGGCKDIEWFKKYIRDNQIPAQVFYSAYRNSSIKNNLNDLLVARTVRQLLGANEIEQLLNGSYRLTEEALKQLRSETATALFLSGSYNRGVIQALNSSLSSSQSSAKGDALMSGAKKSALTLGLAAGAGLTALWLIRRGK